MVGSNKSGNATPPMGARKYCNLPCHSLLFPSKATLLSYLRECKDEHGFVSQGKEYWYSTTKHNLLVMLAFFILMALMFAFPRHLKGVPTALVQRDQRVGTKIYMLNQFCLFHRLLRCFLSVITHVQKNDSTREISGRLRETFPCCCLPTAKTGSGVISTTVVASSSAVMVCYNNKNKKI